MREEFQSALLAAWTLSPDQLPRFLGDLEELRATALARLTAPTPQLAPDLNLDAGEAAKRLGMSKSFVYRNAANFPFAVRMGTRAIKFSSRGIDAYLAGKKRRS